MYPYLTKEDTLKAFRELVEKLHVARWTEVRNANPVLHYALELHFGSFNDAERALNIDAATREVWRVYWEEARKRGYTQRKQLEELKRDSPQPSVIALPDAIDRVEQAPEFVSCRTEHDIKVLALCVIGSDWIMDPETRLRVCFSDSERFAMQFSHPLMRRLGERTGIALDASVSEPADQSLLAFFDLCDEFGIGRESIQELGRDLGAHIPWETAARSMQKALLRQARQTEVLPRLIDLLATQARNRLDHSLEEKADQNQDFTDVRESLNRAKARVKERSWAEARQRVLGLLDTLRFSKEETAAAVARIGLPKAKKSSSRWDLCCHLFDAAVKHGRLDSVLNVLDDELRRQEECAWEEQKEREESLTEDRERYLALLRVLCKEAGIREPDLGHDSNAGQADVSDRLSESGIVSAVAEAAAKRITRKVIAYLQGMDETLSGDDSELKTPWDEICVQVQYEESFFWDAYDETVRGLLRGYVAELPKHEREAIWLQTEAGRDWDCEEPEDREPQPVCDDDILDYLAQEYVYEEAGRWSNARIRAYFDR